MERMTEQFDAEQFALYNSTPASTALSIQAGTPFINNFNLAPGIGVGMALTNIVRLIPTSTPLLTISIPANTTQYLPLSSFVLPEGATLVQGTNDEDTYIDLSYAGQLTFNTENLTITASVCDQYKQKMTYQVVATTTGPYNAPRCGQFLSSIQVQNLSGSAVNLTVSLVPLSFELPYYDFGFQEFLLDITLPSTGGATWINALFNNTSQGILEKLWTMTTAAPNPFAPGLTSTTGTVRSIVTFPSTISYTPPASIPFIPLMVRQSVFGCGNPLPPGLNTPVNGVNMASSLLNNSIAVIGGSQYATGWTGWRG
jgi:hypothetical protein